MRLTTDVRAWIVGLLGAALMALGAAVASAQDGIDLSQAVYHSTPNFSAWPTTVRLEGVEWKPGRASDGNTVGLRPVFDRPDMNGRWPDVQPPGWEGKIQFTLAICVRPDRWRCAGLHEFWSDRAGAPRVWTGAPLLTQWSDWVYRNQWGAELEAYRPQVGDPIVIVLLAGDRRLMDLGPVRERSQAFLTTIMSEGIAVAPAPSVPPLPAPSPSTPTPAPSSDLSGVQQEILDLRGYVAAFGREWDKAISEFHATLEQHRQLLDEHSQRIQQLENRPSWSGCDAAVDLGFVRLPARCGLRPWEGGGQ